MSVTDLNDPRINAPNGESATENERLRQELHDLQERFTTMERDRKEARARRKKKAVDKAIAHLTWKVQQTTGCIARWKEASAVAKENKTWSSMHSARAEMAEAILESQDCLIEAVMNQSTREKVKDQVIETHYRNVAKLAQKDGSTLPQRRRARQAEIRAAGNPAQKEEDQGSESEVDEKSESSLD